VYLSRNVPGRAQLEKARAEAHWWRNYAALYQFAVRVDREAERKAREERRLARIPQQRRPVDLWPVPRAGHARFTPPRRSQ